MEVYFWQNMPSHLQAPAIEQLARIWPDPVHCVWESHVSNQRASMGWTTPEMPSTLETYIDPKRPQQHVHELIDGARDAIHIFSGMNAYRWIKEAYFRAKQTGVERLALMGESGIRLGLRGSLRPYRAKWIARNYRPVIKLVLAMGQAGVDYYRFAGFSEQIIFPYLYQAPVGTNVPLSPTKEIQLIYVGQLNFRKGLDVLLQALGECDAPPWRLTIIGSDPNEQKLRYFAGQLNISGAISWLGVCDHEQVLNHLAEADLCVVPSRFEGWGVVVNEAIGVATPVVCSDGVAAQDLVVFGDCGEVVRTDDVSDLSVCLGKLLRQPDLITKYANNAARYRTTISAQNVANYLKSVLEYTFRDCDVPQSSVRSTGFSRNNTGVTDRIPPEAGTTNDDSQPRPIPPWQLSASADA